MIILSSITSHNDLPFYFRYAGKVKLHKLIPVSLLKYASNIKRLFTAETSEERSVIRKMIRETDDYFIKWAMHAIVTWKGKAERPPALHIHGSRDELLPARFCKPTHVIKGGGHLMVMTRAREINELLNDYFINRHAYLIPAFLLISSSTCIITSVFSCVITGLSFNPFSRQSVKCWASY